MIQRLPRHYHLLTIIVAAIATVVILERAACALITNKILSFSGDEDVRQDIQG